MTTYDVTLVRRIPQSGAGPTLTELGPVKWTDLTVTRECGAAGTLEVTTTVDSLDSGMTAALIDLAAAPCELWCYRDAALIHAGHLSGYRIQGRAITLSGVGLLGYLGFMVRTTDFTATADDQADIVSDLIDQYQALTYGNFGLDTSTLTATGITRDLNLLGVELPHLDEVIGEMGRRTNGYDLDADPESREVLMYSPRQGSDLSAAIIIDGRSIGDPQYAQYVGPGQIASDVIVNSSSADGGKLTADDADTGTRAAFGRTYLTASYQDVAVQATLDEHAARLVEDNADAFHEITPGLLAVAGFDYDDFDVGDVVTYEYDAGLGVQTFELRVKTKVVSMAAGTERMSVGFY